MSHRIPETLDLSLLEGITTYVEHLLITDVRRAFATGRGLRPFGIALGTMTNGTKLPRPQAMAVGDFGMGLRNTKRTLRALAKNSGATGTILLHVSTIERKGTTRDDEVVIIQLEHKEYGDLVWTATVKDGQLPDFVGPLPLDHAAYAIKRTELMPGRWMH